MHIANQNPRCVDENYATVKLCKHDRFVLPSPMYPFESEASHMA